MALIILLLPQLNPLFIEHALIIKIENMAALKKAHKLYLFIRPISAYSINMREDQL
jgi:hypothetical protein